MLEPIFEADFEDNAYGYRPARGVADAVKEVHRHICPDYTVIALPFLDLYFQPPFDQPKHVPVHNATSY